MNKRLIIQLLALIAGVVMYGQSKLSVRSFRFLPHDATANIAVSMRISKQDGQPAALIKVITNERGYNFHGGTYGIVDRVDRPGEIWIYVPDRAQKITITHDRYGRLSDYYFPEVIEAGKTYEMLIDPDQGKYTTIQTSVPRSIVYLDGDSIGVSPVYNTYILYGPHRLMAKNGRMEGEMPINVINDGESATINFTVEMEDQSHHYGSVTIETDPQADIYLGDKFLAMGSWTGELYEGSYEVEARKINCDPARTSFTVKPMSRDTIIANYPTPHVGYLSLFTRPVISTLMIDGKTVPLDSRIQLPIGHHTVQLGNKGYYDTEKEYLIRHNVTQYDTINLQHINYVTPNAFYFGAAYTVSSLGGVSGIIGARYSNVDLQLSYMFGLSKCDKVNYYNIESGRYIGSSQYSLSAIGAKLGYQIALSHAIGFTPQIGVSTHMLNSSGASGNVPAKDLKAACATIGARFMYAPMQHFALFAAPEYDIALSKGQQFDDIAKIGGFSVGGFFCNIGVLINF